MARKYSFSVSVRDSSVESNKIKSLAKCQEHIFDFDIKRSPVLPSATFQLMPDWEVGS